MFLTIYFDNRQTAVPLTYKMKMAVRKAVQTTLEFEDFDPLAVEVSVSFVENEEIQKLNKQYRKKDKVTDVLSFPLLDEEEKANGDTVALGDIVICLSQAEKQAKDIGNTTVEEVAFLAVHSTLHLLGYDHETSKEDEEEMFGKQRTIVGIMKEEP